MIKSKKGFIGDTLTWALVLFGLVLLLFFSLNMISAMNDGFQVSGMSQASIDESAKFAEGWPKWWDSALALFVGLMFITTIVFAWMIGTNPAFFFVSLIVFIFMMMGIVSIHNMLQGIVDTETFVMAKAQMPFTNFLIENLFTVMLLAGILLLIILFAKIKTEQ